MAEANYEELPRPEYTEFGIKFHKLRVTFKVQRRSSSTEAEGRGRGGRGGRGRREERVARDRAHSTGGDSLRLLNLDTTAGSRRPIVHDGSGNSGARLANWEFEGFYSPPARTSTPSSGYSSAAVSRTSSFSSDAAGRNGLMSRSSRITSADDSAYSEVYSTIEELSELPDPFDEEPVEEDPMATLKAKHQPLKATASNNRRANQRPQVNSKSMSSLVKRDDQDELHCVGLPIYHVKTNSTGTILETTLIHQPPFQKTEVMHQRTKSLSTTNFHSRTQSFDLPAYIPPPLPPRSSKCRPPARPPYPSSVVGRPRPN